MLILPFLKRAVVNRYGPLRSTASLTRRLNEIMRFAFKIFAPSRIKKRGVVGWGGADHLVLSVRTASASSHKISY